MQRLQDRSSRPHRTPTRTRAEVESRVVSYADESVVAPTGSAPELGVAGPDRVPGDRPVTACPGSSNWTR